MTQNQAHNLKKVGLIKNEIEQLVYQLSGKVNNESNRVKIADIVYRALATHIAQTTLDGFSTEVTPSGRVCTSMVIGSDLYTHSIDLKSFMTSENSPNKLYNNDLPSTVEVAKLPSYQQFMDLLDHSMSSEVIQETPINEQIDAVECNRAAAYEHAMNIIGKTSY